VCQLSGCSLPGGMAYALRSERSVLVTSRFESGGRDQRLRGRGEKGRRGPKTLSVGPAEKATQVNEQRPTVADAPNGYLSGSLGKRVSKPMLSSSNDRSSANCRFESCRPHQLSRLIVRARGGTGIRAALKTQCPRDVSVRLRPSAPLEQSSVAFLLRTSPAHHTTCACGEIGRRAALKTR
jgi:hypothetical protein